MVVSSFCAYCNDYHTAPYSQCKEATVKKLRELNEKMGQEQEKMKMEEQEQRKAEVVAFSGDEPLTRKTITDEELRHRVLAHCSFAMLDIQELVTRGYEVSAFLINADPKFPNNKPEFRVVCKKELK